MGEIIGPTSGWNIGPTMSDEAWPTWVNKISVLILYFSFSFNFAGLGMKIHNTHCFTSKIKLFQC